MKLFEHSYGQPGSIRRSSSILPGWGPAAAFLLGTVITVYVATSLGSLKYGILNVLGVVVVLVALMILALAFPQVKANYRYLIPKLNRWHWIWYGIYISALVWEVRTAASYRESPLSAWSILRLGPEFAIGMYFLYLLGTGRLKWVSSLFKGIPGVLAAYCLFSALTSIWSVFPPWTLFKSIEYMLDVAVMAAILCVVNTTEDYKTILDWTWTIYAVELVWCCLQ